jgi:formate dehydrogenase
VLERKLRHRDRRVHLLDEAIASEIGRLESANGASADFPLRLIGMRELRSHNSWMHNAELLMRGGRIHAMRIHPDDAKPAGLEDGDVARVTSASGTLETPVIVTDEMTPGTVALPHGWGHRGGWRLANEAGGANVNLLASSEPEALERLAGMSHLNGIPVRVECAAEVPGAGEALVAQA